MAASAVAISLRSRGTGAAICKRLASDGARVVVNSSRSLDAAAAVVAAIEQSGGEARAVQADLSDPAANDHDRISYISSGAARVAGGGRSVYAASKAAVEAFARSQSVDLGPRGITVNAVAPGITVGARIGAGAATRRAFQRGRVGRHGQEHAVQRGDGGVAPARARGTGRAPFDRLGGAAAGERLHEAGLTGAQSAPFRWHYGFPSQEALWEFVSGPGMFTRQFAVLGEADKERVRLEVAASLAAYRQEDGSYQIPHTCRLGWGQR